MSLETTKVVIKSHEDAVEYSKKPKASRIFIDKETKEIYYLDIKQGEQK